MHPALKLGYEVMSKRDADKGTSEAHKMVEDYHKAKSNDDDLMEEARLMTKLLKEADPVLQAAAQKKKLPIGAEPTELVLTRKPEENN